MEIMTTPAVHYNDYVYYELLDKIFKSIRIMSAVLLSLVCVLGVLGNGVVIWATGFKMKKTVSTVWYLNLAVADFLVTAILPLRITYYALDGHWPFGGLQFMYMMDGLVFHMNMYASIFTLVVISVDRCVGVVWPLWARCSGHRTVRKASWVSLGVWVPALALSIPYIFLFRYTKIDSDDQVLQYFQNYTNTDSDDQVLQYYQNYKFTPTCVITNFLVGFVVPFSVIVSCYSVIIYRLRNTRSLAGQSGRSFKTIAAVIATFFLCWIPIHIIQLIRVCYRAGLIEYGVTLRLVFWFGYPITLALALLNSCVNPLLYVFSQGFKDVFRCRSVLKVLEKAFAEEPPQTNNTPPDPALTQITLSGIAGSTGPPGTQDPSA